MADIASIIGQIRPIPIQQADPFKDINQSLTLKALMGQDKLQGLQIGQAERAASDEAALRGAGSMERVRAILGEQGRYKELQALDAADLAKREKESLIGRNTAQTGQANQAVQAARIKDARDALAGVSDQAGYDAWRQAHQGLPVVQSAPPAFAPDWQRRAVMSADQFITQMTPKFERVDLGGRVEMIDVNPLTNPAIRGTKYDKTMTPGEVASDRRAVAQLTETQTHNRAMEGHRETEVANQTTNRLNSNAVELRKEFNALPEVKNYKTVIPIMESMARAPDTAAGDLDLIYGVGKILDPDSVVREGEMTLVIKAGSPLQRFQGAVNNIALGRGRLAPEQRAELKAMLDSRVGGLRSNYDRARTTYEQAADRQKLPKDEIFIDSPAVGLGSPAQERTVTSLPDPAKHNGWSATDPKTGLTYVSDGKSWKRK